MAQYDIKAENLPQTAFISRTMYITCADALISDLDFPNLIIRKKDN